jgi:hypothetical protein
MADALGSGPSESNLVEVQILLPAQKLKKNVCINVLPLTNSGLSSNQDKTKNGVYGEQSFSL